ncbi:MAG: hypothetical protein IJ093_00190 [Bacilli bacterium]|nr:hypothetical protein [Bacilli bacterium]
MKKKIFISVLIVIVIIIASIIFINLSNPKDSVKFKKEYEKLNGQKTENGKNYLKVSISKDNNVNYLEFDEVMSFLEEGTGILYFGFPECPWCRNATPILLEAAKENETDIYYYNALSIRDVKELKDGKIVTTKKGTKNYYKLVDKLKDYLPAYDGLNDENIKRLYFPTVFFLQSGKIVGMHEGTVDSQQDPYIVLTKKQRKELKDIYVNNINKIYGICDESC